MRSFFKVTFTIAIVSVALLASSLFSSHIRNGNIKRTLKLNVLNTPKLGKKFHFSDKVKLKYSAMEKEEGKIQKARENKISQSTLLNYQVKRNDTLMLIAFNIYGDYKRWRELYQINKEILGQSYDLSGVQFLKYRRPLKRYTPPSGNPYLIKRGDSLSKISRKVYGDFRRWPAIYQNNREQMPNPNLIFSGFTLYYPPLRPSNNYLY